MVMCDSCDVTVPVGSSSVCCCGVRVCVHVCGCCRNVCACGGILTMYRVHVTILVG